VLFSSNPRGSNEEGWNLGRYGTYHDFEKWRGYLPKLSGSANSVLLFVPEVSQPAALGAAAAMMSSSTAGRAAR
jgi:hypothetical protein